MTYQQVCDILKVVQKHHQRFREALTDIEDRAGFQDTEMVANALKQHELHWQKALAEYGEEGEQAVLNTWIQYAPDRGVSDMLADIVVTPEMTTGDVRQLFIKFHNALVELYATLKDEVAAPRAKEFFTRLLEQEETLTAEQAWAGRSTQ